MPFSDEDREWLSAPHVGRQWFGDFDMPTGWVYLHNGVGRKTVGGQEYRGISDPIGGQLVGISAIEDPRFGQAAKVDIVLSGITADGFKTWKANARSMEGRTAILRFGLFDPETGAERLFKRMFPGKMSAPTLRRVSVSERYVGLTIEGFWQSQNYPFGGKWSPGDFRQRNGGAKGMDFVGVEVTEQWK